MPAESGGTELFMYMRMIACCLTFFLITTPFYCASAGEEGCIYVSPSGSDSGDGSRQSPVESLFRARELVREKNGNMTGDISVMPKTKLSKNNFWKTKSYF